MEENLKKLSGHLNDYLVHGYPINEKRLGQKQLEVLTLEMVPAFFKPYY